MLGVEHFSSPFLDTVRQDTSYGALRRDFGTTTAPAAAPARPVRFIGPGTPGHRRLRPGRSGGQVGPRFPGLGERQMTIDEPVCQHRVRPGFGDRTSFTVLGMEAASWE
jgi:hypothetical protein